MELYITIIEIKKEDNIIKKYYFLLPYLEEYNEKNNIIYSSISSW